MLGPLPYFHRTVVVTAVLLTAIASGAWIAHFTAVPVAIGGGAVVSAAGPPVANAPVQHQPRPHPARVRRR